LRTPGNISTNRELSTGSAGVGETTCAGEIIDTNNNPNIKRQ
jgi:hypothetical protein